MIWQDVVISICQLFFLFALIPTIRSKTEKPALSTALMTAFFMSVLAPTVFTLDLYLNTIVTILIAICWWTIAWQVWSQRINFT